MNTLKALRPQIDAGEVVDSDAHGYESISRDIDGGYTYWYGDRQWIDFETWEALCEHVGDEERSRWEVIVFEGEFYYMHLDAVLKLEAAEERKEEERKAFNTLLGDIQIDL
jgi:hypothetical protein